MHKEVKVTFQPAGRSVYVLPGTVLLEAAARAGYIIETPCGGRGTCGKCVVRIVSGTCKACEQETHLLDKGKTQAGYRLACQCKVQDNLVVEVPSSSLFQDTQKILSEDSGEETHLEPAVTKRFVRLIPPKQGDALSDAERLRKELGPVDIDLAVMQALPTLLRKADFEATATVIDNRVVNIEPGDTSETCYGIAFDIGTTTVVGTLVELISGKDAAVASRINPQTSFGDDVISRIQKCRNEDFGLRQLRDAILGAVNDIVSETAKAAGIEKHAICEAVFCGNTTMQQILSGIDPSSLGELPFVPAFRDLLRTRARDFNLDIHPGAEVSVFPQIGGFVGGDTVAGVLATHMEQHKEPMLLVDVGTNGEIVLSHNGALLATSVAAGPAFEGARIVNGMRATAGAVEKVVINEEVKINVVGNTKPSGICGTGLIDAAAWLLRSGVVDTTGRILGPEELPPHVPDTLRHHVRKDDGQFSFVLAPASETATGEPLCLYQKDIRELQLANAAIRAGIQILLRMEGLEPSDLSVILLAGAFGNFIRRSNAKRIGMLPQVSSDRIRFVGNAASFGAKRALLSKTERECARQIVKQARHIDLSQNADFQTEFSEGMLFPEDDA